MNSNVHVFIHDLLYAIFTYSTVTNIVRCKHQVITPLDEQQHMTYYMFNIN